MLPRTSRKSPHTEFPHTTPRSSHPSPDRTLSDLSLWLNGGCIYTGRHSIPDCQAGIAAASHGRNQASSNSRRLPSNPARVAIEAREAGRGVHPHPNLGQERGWKPLAVGQPDVNPTVAHARWRIEDLEGQQALLRDGVSPDASPAFPETWAGTAATHPRSSHTPYPAVFLLTAPARDGVSSTPFRPVPCRTARTTSTQTHHDATSGGIAACGPPPAGPWCRRR